MSIRQTTLFACLLSMTFSASAHEYSCRAIKGTRAVTIASFRFTPAELQQAQSTHNAETCSIPIQPQASSATAAQKLQSTASKPNTPLAAARPDSPKGDDKPPMCGVVDGEHFHIASEMSMSYCSKQATSAGASTAKALKPGGKVAFRIRAPRSYNGAQHHAMYKFSDGDVVGVCYICVPIKTVDQSNPIRRQEAARPKD